MPDCQTLNRSDAIILGAGAAGLMCAAEAGRMGRKVAILEKAEKPGKKILISGGGRCNFTNIHTAADRYISGNPHFVKSALSGYGADDFLALVERYGIAWHEKTLGQLFCDGSARQIVEMLMSEVRAGGGTLACGQEIETVERYGDLFHVTTAQGSYCAPALVVATGGPSIPKMGATGFAYDLARQFGLKIVEPRPALVPLTLGGDEVFFREISGLSSDVVARAGNTCFREAALFTHRGLSGPAILQISSYWRPGEPIHINFQPDQPSGWLIEAKRAMPRSTVRTHLRQVLPDRLADVLYSRLDQTVELANTPDASLRNVEERLANWPFHPNGTEGFAKAEVTVGGISTSELSSKTMEAKKIRGLYCIGEAVDVTGWLGGYNFQWAWSSAVAAARNL
jgi:predicted Rossmann fold flavoprotein